MRRPSLGARRRGAAGGHSHADLVMIRGAPRRQSAQFGAFQRDQLLAPGIAPANEVGDPIAIELEAVEVSAAAQQQGLSNGTLAVTVLAVDRAVLVRYAAVVAGRLHAIVRA